MEEKDHTIVVGGGFAGLVASYLAASQGQAVTLVSASPLGGIAGGVAWGEFSLDLGCHIFGNSHDRTTEVLLALLDNEVLPVHMRFASQFGGRRLEGFELPDLASVADSAQMVFEIAEAVGKEYVPAQNLAELLTQRFGPTAADAAAKAFYKIYRTSPERVAPEAIAATCFKRVRVAEDSIARVLKQSPLMDAVIAAGSQEDPMKYYASCERASYRAFYPSRGGMRGFVDSAKRVLEGMGVRFVLGEAIESMELGSRVEVTTNGSRVVGEQCVWTAGVAALEQVMCGTKELKGTSYGVPMSLFYFDFAEEGSGPYSYVNNYDSDSLVFRAALPGSYGQGTNCPAGRRYLCCEVPTDVEAEVFKAPELFADRVWEEARGLGVVTGGYDAVKTLTTPVSYKVPTAEYAQRAQPVREQFAACSELVISDEWAFTKNAIIVDLEKRMSALASSRRAA